MGNDTRKGNRSSIPSRGGLRRSNTPPPPSVRLGIDGLPETEPISTSRPRVDELPKTAPVMEQPPADVVAAAAPAPSVAPKQVAPEVVVPPAAKSAPKVEPEPAPVVEVRASEPASIPPAAGEDAGARPSSLPRRSLPPANRKRGSNLKGAPGKSLAPPPVESAAPAVAAATAIVQAATAPSPDEASTAKAPPVAVQAGVAETTVVETGDAAEERAPVSKSMPPASRDLDEGFFDHGEHAADVDAHAADLDNYDEKMAHKNSPEARARRAKLWRYVLGAVAACVFLLFIADVKSRWGHGEPVSDTPPMVAVMPPPPPPVNSAVVAPEPPPVAVVVPPATSADDLPAPAPVASGAASAKAGEPGAPAPADSKGWVAEPAAPAAAAAPGAPPAAAEPSADDKKSAAQQKRTCQGLLDQGAFAKAIEAGEHSVALDPTDGEAWLLLGAAYQSIGKGADARRTFASCVAEAKRGPINECRSMLH